jgi:hypothetical protein
MSKLAGEDLVDSLGIVIWRNQPMPTEHYVEERNLSVAWGRGLRLVSARGCSEATPLIVAVTGFNEHGEVDEEPRIRSALENLLESQEKQTIETVANTIFPRSLWNPMAPREQLFERYLRIFPKIQRATRKNSRGTYFERMIIGGPQEHENQLEFSIASYLARTGVRRSVLQVAIFNPSRDHSSAAQLGFPCLQHVSFAPSDEGLCVNAFYATQYMVERAYGNYLGLCRLGQFVAHEMRMPLTRLTCFTGIAECEIAKRRLAPVLDVIDYIDPTGRR